MIKFPTGVKLMFICKEYIYAGVIKNANHENVELKDAEIIYDSGSASKPHWNEGEYLGNWNISISAIESWGACEKTLKPSDKEKPYAR